MTVLFYNAQSFLLITNKKYMKLRCRNGLI